jgi:hypothetical protein
LSNVTDPKKPTKKVMLPMGPVKPIPRPVYEELPSYDQTISKSFSQDSNYLSFREHDYVEYDMDERDRYWADAHHVDYDSFEQLIDFLEKQWFLLSAKLPQESNLGTLEDDGNCVVCDDGECENVNAIVFCDGCNIAVHQECYGVPYIPEGQWLCRKCMHPDTRATCLLCGQGGGALKQTTDHRWAHVLCALWIPEVTIANTVYMEPIDVSDVPQERSALICTLCKQRVGACIQCMNRLCYSAFHVTCARSHGLYMQQERVYCERHLPPSFRKQKKKRRRLLDRCDADAVTLRGYDDEGDVLDEADARSDGDEINIMDVDEERFHADEATALQPSRHPYEYDTSKPVVPHFIHERMTFQFPNVSEEILVTICRYWSIKRQARGGAPLLRRLFLDPQPKDSSDAKRRCLELLRHDLEKIRVMCDQVRRRERFKLHALNVWSQAWDVFLDPLRKSMTKILDRLKALDNRKIFHFAVDTDEVPDYLDVIMKPMDFSVIQRKIQLNLYDSFEEFEFDVELILRNCQIYNRPDTFYFRLANKLREAAKPLLRAAQKELELDYSFKEIPNELWPHLLGITSTPPPSPTAKSRIENAALASSNQRLNNFGTSDSSASLLSNNSTRRKLASKSLRRRPAPPVRLGNHSPLGLGDYVWGRSVAMWWPAQVIAMDSSAESASSKENSKGLTIPNANDEIIPPIPNSSRSHVCIKVFSPIPKISWVQVSKCERMSSCIDVDANKLALIEGTRRERGIRQLAWNLYAEKASEMGNLDLQNVFQRSLELSKHLESVIHRSSIPTQYFARRAHSPVEGKQHVSVPVQENPHDSSANDRDTAEQVDTEVSEFGEMVQENETSEEFEKSNAHNAMAENRVAKGDEEMELLDKGLEVANRNDEVTTILENTSSKKRRSRDVLPEAINGKAGNTLLVGDKSTGHNALKVRKGNSRQNIQTNLLKSASDKSTLKSIAKRPPTSKQVSKVRVSSGIMRKSASATSPKSSLKASSMPSPRVQSKRKATDVKRSKTSSKSKYIELSKATAISLQNIIHGGRTRQGKESTAVIDPPTKSSGGLKNKSTANKAGSSDVPIKSQRSAPISQTTAASLVNKASRSSQRLSAQNSIVPIPSSRKPLEKATQNSSSKLQSTRVARKDNKRAVHSVPSIDSLTKRRKGQPSKGTQLVTSGGTKQRPITVLPLHSSSLKKSLRSQVNSKVERKLGSTSQKTKGLSQQCESNRVISRTKYNSNLPALKSQASGTDAKENKVSKPSGRGRLSNKSILNSQLEKRSHSESEGPQKEILLKSKRLKRSESMMDAKRNSRKALLAKQPLNDESSFFDFASDEELSDLDPEGSKEIRLKRARPTKPVSVNKKSVAPVPHNRVSMRKVLRSSMERDVTLVDEFDLITQAAAKEAAFLAAQRSKSQTYRRNANSNWSHSKVIMMEAWDDLSSEEAIDSNEYCDTASDLSDV